MDTAVPGCLEGTARAARTSACSASTTLWPVWATPAATTCRSGHSGRSKALKDAAIDAPYTITVYGTPAEESISGKVVMLENGCTFEELDVALMMHGGPATQVDVKSLALNKLKIIYTVSALTQRSSPKRAAAHWTADPGLSGRRVPAGARSLGCSDALHHRRTAAAPGGNVVPGYAEASMYVRSYNRDGVGRRGGPRQEGTSGADDDETEVRSSRKRASTTRSRYWLSTSW